MKAHVIENGVVINSIEVESLDFMPGLVEADDMQVGIGWRYDGQNFMPPEPAPTPVPDVISRAQGKSTLIYMNLWSAVLQQVDAIEDATEKELALVALNDTQEWRRDSLFLNRMSNALGLTSEQLDQLFIDAAGVVF